MHRFFFFWIPYSLRNALKKLEIVFSTGSTGWESAHPVQRISVEVHYGSTFKFGAPEFVLVISPSFGLGRDREDGFLCSSSLNFMIRILQSVMNNMMN